MTTWTIDRICALTTNPEVLNAFHACQPGHPLNNAWQWRNAWAMALQRPSHEIQCDAVAWLLVQATIEASPEAARAAADAVVRDVVRIVTGK